jgi:hypothetical protein
MNIRRVFMVVGPESSGTRILTRLLCMAGCIGDYGHEQRLDRFVYEDGISIKEIFEYEPKTIVLRRSIPHYPNVRPDIIEIGTKFKKAGFEPFYIVAVRDWICTAKSKVRTEHCQNWPDAKMTLAEEWAYIGNCLGYFAGHFYMVITSCLFINPERTLKSLEDWIRLQFPPGAKEILYDADLKYYQ